MRTDVKIGIVVALFIVIVMGVYFAFTGPKAPAGNDANVTGNTPSRGTPAPTSSPAASPSGGSGVITPRISGVTPRSDTTTTTPAVPSAPRDSAPLPPSTVTVVVPRLATTPTTPPAPTPSIAPAIVPPITPSIPPSPTLTTPTAAEHTYTVQEGDGFWSIAQKEYGDGSKYTHIAKANPGVESNSLRPGQKLKIPPMPAAAPTPATPVAGTPAGGGDQGSYVVQSGDAAWSIAEKVYGKGNGKNWTLIEKANPGVKMATLRIGQKLVIPPLPGAAPAGTSTSRPSGAAAAGTTASLRSPAAPPVPTPTPAPGQRTYTVQAGDSGLFDVAVHAYGEGNGSYWHLIAQANQHITSGNLREGMKLIIPPLPGETSGTTTSRPAGSRGSASAVSAGTSRGSSTARPAAKSDAGDSKPRFD